MAIILPGLMLDIPRFRIGIDCSLASMALEIVSARNFPIPVKTQKCTLLRSRRPAVDRAKLHSAGIGEPGCDRRIR